MLTGLSLEPPLWLDALPPLPDPGQGKGCPACCQFLPVGAFRSVAEKGHPAYLRAHCIRCERAADPEERAKSTLLQRARAGRLAWPLFRELRAERRCAEWLADHPARGFSEYRRYGHVYVLRDAAGIVLYVGQAVDVEARLFITPQSHRFDKEWWGEVATADVYTYRLRDYDEGERWLIQDLHPIYNKVRPKPRRDVKPEPISIVTGEIWHGGDG